MAISPKRQLTTHHFLQAGPFRVAFLLAFLLLSLCAGAQTWTGIVSSDWNQPLNWNPTAVPTSLLPVTIPATSFPQFSPVIDANTTAVALNVTVEAGAQLAIEALDQSHIGQLTTTLLANYGTVDNQGRIRIETVLVFPGQGIENYGTFTNDPQGNIPGLGIITIANTTVSGDGIYNEGSFFNNQNASIEITAAPDNGIENATGAEFGNAGSISIGTTGAIGSNGIYNQATFSNNNSGQINIDNTGNTALYSDRPFTNAAAITIGATGVIGGDGISNSNNFGQGY